jgi:hypothetical protein
VANIEKLEYVQKHSTKCEKVNNIQDRQVARLKGLAMCKLIWFCLFRKNVADWWVANETCFTVSGKYPVWISASLPTILTVFFQRFLSLHTQMPWKTDHSHLPNPTSNTSSSCFIQHYIISAVKTASLNNLRIIQSVCCSASSAKFFHNSLTFWKHTPQVQHHWPLDMILSWFP